MGNLVCSFLLNAAGRSRLVIEDGRQKYLVPMTLLVPGVLAGSDGPIHYPDDEVRKSASAWNGQPIVVYHPTNPDGKPISAKTPRGYKLRIGELRNARWRPEARKLVADGVIDVEDARRVDARVLESLRQNAQIELSTGLGLEKVSEIGIDRRGRAYTLSSRNYVPDHLAILPDQVGACSLRDGCGVNVNQRSKVNSMATGPWQEALAGAGAPRVKELTNNMMDGPYGASPDGSLNDRLERVRCAFRDAFPGRYDPSSGSPVESNYLVSVFDDYVIYRRSWKGPRGEYQSEYYRVGYEADAEGNVLFSGEPQAVLQQVKWVPIDD